MKIIEHVRYSLTGRVVQIAGRFVGEEHARAAHNGPGDHDSLLLTAG
jgi:hypothetical protein